jgi:hypothetical protein
MTSVIQFSWSRLEGIGLIIASLGIGLMAQIPPILFALILLYLDFEKYFIAISGTILGSSIILATISCSIVEDWDESSIPELKSIITISLAYLVFFLLGFFSFFLIEQFLPPEAANISPEQRYFSAMAIALFIVGIITVAIYKGKTFFRG